MARSMRRMEIMGHAHIAALLQPQHAARKQHEHGERRRIGQFRRASGHMAVRERSRRVSGEREAVGRGLADVIHGQSWGTSLPRRRAAGGARQGGRQPGDAKQENHRGEGEG